ncbi:MAG: glyceraldehyde-3-phosphate dehydrogenase [Planctomycetota bacterium]|nr:MAG: glyceraldehyde-3-phosphate dehydrogenase [Planctomycetota bacterium]
MPIKVGINGFGRIGRVVFRILWERRAEFEVVGINNVPFDPVGLANLLRYDTVYGRFPERVELADGTLTVGERRIPFLSEKEPRKLPWGELGAQIVLESTGVFRTREQCAQHLEAGAGRVLLSAPAKGEVDATVVIGVNDGILGPEHRVVSNASCTTNCLAPVAKVLHERFGITEGLMTTVHAVTNDQTLLDLVHPKDPRRGRAGAFNLVPTSTGAAKAVGLVLPELNGRLNGIAIRAPVPVGSVVDLVAVLEREASVQEINAAMREAAQGPLAGVLGYTEDPVVSSDVVREPVSALFDAGLTMRIGARLVKVCAWYDNEWGFSHRCADLMRKLAALG